MSEYEEYVCRFYPDSWGEKSITLFGVPIVRCRDCKYADETESGLLLCIGYLVESWDWYNDMPSDGVKVKPDGFCAWGERRQL